jgi:MFS family permease
LYLDTIGLSTTVIGWIFTAALAGGAVMTILITTLADTVDRKPRLILGALLMALAGWLFAVNSNPFAQAISPEKLRFWSILVLLLSIRSTTADGIVTPVARVASCV